MFMPGIGRVAIIPNGPRLRRCPRLRCPSPPTSRAARKVSQAYPLSSAAARAIYALYVHLAPAVGRTETLIGNGTGRGAR
jgi:hypothetical protein